MVKLKMNAGEKLLVCLKRSRSVCLSLEQREMYVFFKQESNILAMWQNPIRYQDHHQKLNL